MARRPPSKPPWWSTWPSAVGLGLLSLVMVLTCSVPLFLYALVAGPQEATGTDLETGSGLAIGWRVAYLVLSVLLLALPVATVWTARRRLLGFLLWALVLSVLVLFGGLWIFGVV